MILASQQVNVTRLLDGKHSVYIGIQTTGCRSFRTTLVRWLPTQCHVLRRFLPT